MECKKKTEKILAYSKCMAYFCKAFKPYRGT